MEFHMRLRVVSIIPAAIVPRFEECRFFIKDSRSNLHQQAEIEKPQILSEMSVLYTKRRFERSMIMHHAACATCS